MLSFRTKLLIGLICVVFLQGYAVDKQQAANFTLEDLQGNKIALSDYKGKVVVLNFWATWCAPCLRDMPVFENIHKKYSDDVQVLGIAVVSKLKDIPKQANRARISYPILFGSKKIIADYNNFYSIPQTFILNRDGEVVTQIDGSVTARELEKELEAVLDQK